MYSWNPDGFDWYIKNSGLNSVELNSSFYRFPYPNQIRSWSRKTVGMKEFRWSVKIHRSISHYKKLSEESIPIFMKFRRLFEPLDTYIDFYLLQLPPSFRYNERNIEKIRFFTQNIGLGIRLAVEFRDESWFRNQVEEIGEKYNFIVVSVDSPITTYVTSTHDIVYLRMHGRTDWYIHYYTDKELEAIAEKILDTKPKKIYVYFNNDHDMLENARRFMEVMKKIL